MQKLITSSFTFCRSFIFLCFALSFFMGISQAPECTQLSSPTDGSTKVSVTTNLEWEAAARATEYVLIVGTTFGGNDILNNVSVGNVTQYNLPENLPFGQSIYVAIIPINSFGANGNCAQIQFTTETSDGLPACTAPISPEHAAQNISTTPTLTWQAAEDADGYLLTIGTTSGEPPILNRFDVGNVTSFISPNLAQGSTYYFSVIPYNAVGAAQGCGVQSSFTTRGATIETKLFCTELLQPENGSEAGPSNVELRWKSIAGAQGYLLSIGTDSESGAFLNRLNVGNATSFEISQELPMATRINVLIVPYNTNGEADNCSAFSFTTIESDLEILNTAIPKFFTPNNDGVNDSWSVSSLAGHGVEHVSIFDRFGKLLVQLSPSQNWDGTLNGSSLPSGSYWYRVQITNQPSLSGAVMLKR